MKIFLLSLSLLVMANLNAQNGNTISNPIVVDGTTSNVSTFGNDITNSGLSPSCISSEDVFYKHTVETGNNKMTIGMASAAITAIANVDYQIFMAPNGDVNQLQELDCDYYTVWLVTGGDFTFVINDVNSTNNYYLRVYKSTDAGASLADLMNNTNVTMTSEYDASLSNDEVDFNNFNYSVGSDSIELSNNIDVSNYMIYGIEGKLVAQSTTDNRIESIDISSLSKGVYVLNLRNSNLNKAYKFLKY